MSELNSKLSKEIFKAILSLIGSKVKELENDCNQYIKQLDEDPSSALSKITGANSKLNQVFTKNLTEYFSWQGAYRSIVAKNQKYSNDDSYRTINIDEHLLSYIPKINNINEPSGTYTLNTITLCKKKGWDKQFAKIWKNARDDKYNSKTKQKEKYITQKYKKDDEKAKEKSTQKRVEKNEQKIDEQNVVESKVKNPEIEEQPKKERKITGLAQEIQKQQEIRKNAKNNAEQMRKQKFARIIKYLEFISAGVPPNSASSGPNYSHTLNNGNFYISTQNIEHIAKQLLLALQKFMNDKVRQVLHVAKLKHQGYKSQFVGNEFRFFGQNGQQSLMNESKQAVTKLPQYENNIKFAKLTLPSKLEIYFGLRVQQLRHEQYFKNQVRNKIGDLDRKSDKFLQNYTFEEQKRQKQEKKVDFGQSQTNRLKITANCVQYVIENDPFFRDSWVMEKSLIND